MATEVGTDHDNYLQQPFHRGTRSIALRDFIFQTFSHFQTFISPTIKGAIALSYPPPLLLLMTHHEEMRLNANRSPNPNPLRRYESAIAPNKDHY